MRRREPAWRVFASEYNDATFEVKGTGEKTPSYVITPLGAKVNRLFIVGVLTDMEHISEGGEMVRAHISDPTGVFTLYSGQFQPQATAALSTVEVPTFVAVVGKARTYEPEPGALFVSVRPELVREVKADVRDQWIVETCRQTKDRIAAVFEARKMNPPNAYDLRKLGYSRELSEGVISALKHYREIEVSKYVAMLQESLQYFLSGREEKPVAAAPVEEKEEPERERKREPKREKKGKREEKQTVPVDADEIETMVLNTIKSIEGENGAAWDDIVHRCENAGLTEEAVEEALTSLMDKGFIYEPVLGTIKTT